MLEDISPNEDDDELSGNKVLTPMEEEPSIPGINFIISFHSIYWIFAS